MFIKGVLTINTQIFKDIAEGFNVLAAIEDEKFGYEFNETINGEHYFRIVPKAIHKRYEFCIIRKRYEPWISMTNYFELGKHGYPIIKVMIDYDSNIIRVTTRVKPDLMTRKPWFSSNFEKTTMKIPYDRIEKYKKAGVEPKDVRLYSWGSNYYCFIEHYFKLSKKNFERLQVILNIFPSVIEHKNL